MSAHTPGPWEIDPRVSSRVRTQTTDPTPMSGKTVTVVHCLADAFIIAAAPELLAALEDLEEAWAHVRLMPCDGRSHGPDTTEECEECGNASALAKRAEAARAAIAKARGGK